MRNFKFTPDKFGGTEYMARNINERILSKCDNITKYTLTVLPGIAPEFYETVDGKNIMWLHNTPLQYEPRVVTFLLSPTVMERTVRYIVPSEFAKTSWVEKGLDANKIRVIPNAISVNEKVVPKQIDKNNVRLIYTSYPSRGLEILLKATELFDFNFELDVFGPFRPGEIEFEGKLGNVKWVHKLKNLQKINFYGVSPQTTVHKHIRNSDIFIYPAVFLETFCLAAAEALALGKPVITTDYGALREVLGYHPEYITFEDRLSQRINNGYGEGLQMFSEMFPNVYGRAVQAIADATNKMVANYPSADKLELQAREIQDKYSWDRIEQQWLDLDRELGNL